jgi:hypothetical protein
MARGRKTGGRKKGTRNRATEEARAAAAAAGTMPLDYMLAVMRDISADTKRRDAMAMAAAPYLHPKVSSVDVSDRPPFVSVSAGNTHDKGQMLQVSFVTPKANGHAQDH